MSRVSGTSICTWSMWLWFQIGSNSPLAKRNARMLSAASFPRKWSMRKICSSVNVECSDALSAVALRRSVPNGFSRMIRERSARPARPSVWTTRWPRSAARSGSAAGAECRRAALGLGDRRRQTVGDHCPGRRGRACARSASHSRVGEPAGWRTRRRPDGRPCGTSRRRARRARCRRSGTSGISRLATGAAGPGSSLRRARSPVAPNSTITCGSSGDINAGAMSRSSPLMTSVRSGQVDSRTRDGPGPGGS